eukprot:80304-Rhodomonas_salina.1
MAETKSRGCKVECNVHSFSFGLVTVVHIRALTSHSTMQRSDGSAAPGLWGLNGTARIAPRAAQTAPGQASNCTSLPTTYGPTSYRTDPHIPFFLTRPRRPHGPLSPPFRFLSL